LRRRALGDDPAKSSTVMRSATPITKFMSCSTRSTGQVERVTHRTDQFPHQRGLPGVMRPRARRAAAPAVRWPARGRCPPASRRRRTTHRRRCAAGVRCRGRHRSPRLGHVRLLTQHARPAQARGQETTPGAAVPGQHHVVQHAGVQGQRQVLERAAQSTPGQVMRPQPGDIGTAQLYPTGVARYNPDSTLKQVDLPARWGRSGRGCCPRPRRTRRRPAPSPRQNASTGRRPAAPPRSSAQPCHFDSVRSATGVTHDASSSSCSSDGSADSSPVRRARRGRARPAPGNWPRPRTPRAAPPGPPRAPPRVR